MAALGAARTSVDALTENGQVVPAPLFLLSVQLNVMRDALSRIRETM